MKKAWLVLLLTLIIAGACKLPAPGGAAPTAVDSSILFTAAAETSQAIRLGKGEDVPTLRPEALIKTSLAPTVTPKPAGTQTTPTKTPLPTNTRLPTLESASESDRVEFVADVNVPDGTVVQAGGNFIKTWRLKNTGKKTWTTNYSIYFVEGDILGAPAEFPMPQQVNPGQEVDISVELIAPSAAGNYRGNWKLKNSSGQVFGIGEEGDKPFWFEVVVADTQEGQPAQTKASSEEVIQDLTFSVDQSEVVSQDCPHTFMFLGEFTLDKPAAVTYKLEAQAPNYDIEIKLPPPLTNNLKAGQHQVEYELEFDNQIEGWARMVFIDPPDIKSPQVNFSLECR